MTRVQYTVNGLALLARTLGLAVYDARTLGCLLMACILDRHQPRRTQHTQPSLRKVTSMTDRNYNPTAYVFRVIREQIDGQTVRVLLEPYMGIQHLEIHEGDEFITGTLNTSPWEESDHA